MNDPSISIVIPTYNREQVLIDTIAYLLEQTSEVNFYDFIIIDQTVEHQPETKKSLQNWHDAKLIQWIQIAEPHIVKAMNLGMSVAKSEIVLFTDDDIIPCKHLLRSHIQAHIKHPEVTAVAGQVLQPNQKPETYYYEAHGKNAYRYIDFPFNNTQSGFVENVMAGNLSIKCERALKLGGFDESFTPPVSSRFETDFAKRVIAAQETIWFEPAASIHHLRAPSGGTRSKGNFLKSASPIYAVGDYYYALRHARGWERFTYIPIRPLRQVRTKFHLRHPWWIPIKLIGEARAFYQAWKLYRKPPQLRFTPSEAPSLTET